MGFGGLHVDGSTGVELGNPCGPDGCFEEGVSGRRPDDPRQRLPAGAGP
jgi:hypothetical protein